MISAIRGVLESRRADGIVVAVGPVSLRLQVPAPTLAALGQVGEDVQLFTHLYIREDQWSLYGFATEEERRWFEMLLGVPGVGPKIALAILSTIAGDTLREALAQGNAEPLTRVPGVGKKLAGRLVLELQSRMAAGQAPGLLVSPEESELVDALTNLGYTPGEAQAALRALPADQPLATEEKLLLALRHLANR